MVTSYDICFLLGLPCVTQLGQYMPDLMNTYGASLSVMIIAVVEMVAFMWGYGVNNFCRDIKHMLGFTPGWYFKICWVLISSLFLVAIFIAACSEWQLLSYGSVPYPAWAHTIGWELTLLSVVQSTGPGQPFIQKRNILCSQEEGWKPCYFNMLFF